MTTSLGRRDKPVLDQTCIKRRTPAGETRTVNPPYSRSMSSPHQTQADRTHRYGYRGRARREAESTDGVYLREATYEAGTRLPAHQHARRHLCFVLGGRYVESFDQEQHLRTPGTLILYPPNVAHGEHHEEAGRHLIIDFELPDSTADRLPSRRPLATQPSPRGRVAVRELRHRMDPRHSRRPASLDDLAQLLIVLSFDAGQQAGTASDPPWLEGLDPWLETHWREPPTLTALAAELGLHPSHLARVIKRCRGRTLSRIVLQRKVIGMQEAIEQAVLQGRSLDLAGAALDCGFCDQSHMNRGFRAETSLTPRQYRRLVEATESG